MSGKKKKETNGGFISFELLDVLLNRVIFKAVLYCNCATKHLYIMEV